MELLATGSEENGRIIPTHPAEGSSANDVWVGGTDLVSILGEHIIH